MGCCGTRDVFPSQRDQFQSEELEGVIKEYEKQKRTLDLDKRAEGLEELDKEPRLVEDIEQHAKDLAKWEGWTTEYEVEDMVLRSITEGKLAPEVRVAYMQVKFSQKATVEGVFKALEVPQVRMQWDTTVLEMKETPPISRNTRVVYTAINHVIFGRPKDFVEKKAVKRCEKDITVVCHSTENMVVAIQSFPEVQGRDRCTTVMCVYWIEAKEGVVTLRVVRQTDYKLPWIVNLFGVLGKTYLVTWMTQLKAAVETKS